MHKNHSLPLISIAMTTYNGEKYLKEQLDSIYAQTYKNIEVIVCDDCSSDGTVEILKEYSQQYNLKYYRNTKNIGLVKNFEKAILLCRGDFIALSDQDDIWHEKKLSVLFQKLSNNLLIHSDCRIMDSENNILQNFWKRNSGYDIKIENLLFQNVVTGCTILFKKELLKTALPFPEALIYHDWWLAMCSAIQNKICYTEECLIDYRVHASQDTGMELNQFILQRVWKEASKRILNIPTRKYNGMKKNALQLHAIKEDGRCLLKDSVLLADAIAYADNYLKDKVHLKTFFIGLKYNLFVYPRKNYFFLKNILLDIIG